MNSWGVFAMLKINNWSSHQSYKDRRPPWIRFHKTMLDNYEFHSMSVNARALLPMFWLLASEDDDPTSGMIQDNYKKIAFRLRCAEKEIISAVMECMEAGFLQVIEKQSCIDSVHESLRDSTQTVTSETETETETYREEAEKNIGDFENFWILYGKIGNKQNALKAFNRIKGVDYETIIRGLSKYQEYCRALNQEQRFIKHASSWLNARGWEDEYTIQQHTVRKSPTADDNCTAGILLAIREYAQ